VVLTEVCRTLPLRHPSGNVNRNCRIAKLSIETLPNWRVSDAESKMVGGAVERNGSNNWKRTSASVTGKWPAVTFNVTGVTVEHG